MKKITTVTDLKSAIQQLEYKQANEWPLLKEQFLITSESLKPINIIKNTIKEVVTATDFKTTIVNAAVGFTTGLVAKKAFVGGSHNPLTKLTGAILEMVVANKVAKNAEEIKSIGSIILKKIINLKNNSETA